MCNLTYRRLHLAPLHRPKHALDIGTGTGIWAMDFGKHIRTFLEWLSPNSSSGPISQMRGDRHRSQPWTAYLVSIWYILGHEEHAHVSQRAAESEIHHR